MNKLSFKRPTIIVRNIFLYIVCIVFLDLVTGSVYMEATKNNTNNLFFQEKNNWFRVPSNYFNHGFLPSISTKYTWGVYDYTINTNSIGFIDKSTRKVPQKTDKYRILLLGDSFVEGLGIQYKDTFAGILDQSLQPDNVEILNGAVMSYSPKLYYYRAKYALEFLKLKIDEVIVFIDLSDERNEVYDYQNFIGSNDKNTIYISDNKDNDMSKQIYRFITHHSLLTYSYLFIQNKINAQKIPYTYMDVQEDWTFNKKLYNVFGKKGLELGSESMIKLIALIRKHGINNISIVVYPWPEQIKQNDLNSVDVSYWAKFTKDHNVNFINLFPAFFNSNNPDSLFIADGVHWNEEGHKLVASSLFNVLGTSTKSAQTISH